MLITLEGLDGSGKTTAWEALQASDVLPPETTFTREPTDSWYGEAVARSLSDPEADPLAELFLYTADHAAHLSETVEPALQSGNIVISDRYSDSRYAYQGAVLEGVVDEPVSFVQSIHEPWTRPPDATLYLDVDPETAANRSDSANKFETAAHLATVQDIYEHLLATEPDRFIRIDASQPEPAVVSAVLSAVGSLLE